MTDKKISDLNAATSVYDSDDLPIVQSGETKQVNASVIKGYIGDAPTIIGGTINGTPVGVSIPAAGSFITITASGQVTLTNNSGYNVYASGTGANYFAGAVGIGGTPTGNSSVASYKPMTGGSAYNYGFNNVAQINSDVTAEAVSFQSYLSTQAAAFTAANVRHFKAFQSTIGAGSSVTSQVGYYVDPSLTGATNNYGFYSNIASGTNRWNFYAAGTADNLFAGKVIIGPSGDAGTTLALTRTLTGATSVTGAWLSASVLSDATVNAFGFRTNIGTQVASFTLPSLVHVFANQAAFGAGSTVTNQYGFNANSTLTGATNNYGFYSNIASGTGRYNFYAAGTADNYFAGASIFNADLLIGTITAKTVIGVTPEIQLSSASNAFALITKSQENSSGSGLILGKSRGTEASPTIVVSGDTLGSLFAIGYDGANYIQAATITTAVDGTPGTNDMPGRLVFSTTADGASSPTERIRIDSTGSVGIGGSGGAAFTLRCAKQITGATSVYNIASDATIQSDVTGTANLFYSAGRTTAAAFTLTNLRHFAADQGTIGAGSTVGTQSGFYVNASLTGATNNYGFYSNIASGTGRYNFYAAGTANNYFSGALGIGGGIVLSSQALAIGKQITGFTTAYGVTTQGEVQSDVTSQARYYSTYAQTAASAFTLSTLGHFYATQGTIGAGSTVTNQYGVFVESSLTGATNNYGFYSNIASGTGRYNFYAAGTADNYFAGAVGIGVLPSVGFNLNNTKDITGGAQGYGYNTSSTIQSDVTTTAVGYNTYLKTAAATFTLHSLNHFDATQAPFGAGSTVTNQRGFLADSSLTGATNNYGFYSNIASGTSRYNFYAAGTADNYFAGKVGVGVTGSISGVANALAITGGVNAQGYRLESTVNSDVTNQARGYVTFLSSQATAFTLSSLYHFHANQSTIGAGSTVTNQIGFLAETNLTGATNNFGFYSNIASGTGRYNFYAAGTASNYLGGDLTFKPLASATPANNGDLTFQATSNTSLTIKLKGSDGVVRSVSLTLA